METLYWIIFAIPSIIIASTVHEFAHAFTADKLGDPTPRSEGRLSLNPLVHIDPIGAIMLIVAKIGWSKPVPIYEQNFSNPVQGTALTALAGPASNLALTLLTALIYNLFFTNSSPVVQAFIFAFVSINLSLMIFNLLPIPPLDGHKIVRALLPRTLRYMWEMAEKYSIWIILLLFIPFSPLYQFTSTLISSILNFFLNILF
ncbi:MAG: Peptidase M50 [candidate division WS6 bacterium GW2011_GWF2_39_15]|uniref:Peptidase M50 n=1 Tax=candidate division WS6 bacterium GW2011_GWF2_39_15 TaxID=1619100 RepID=A0A0G0QXK7_9BACT|nr:MAG: Peptidase M50 [candidate division WS6 bacterium GW2011_GWF2_39_15]